MQLTSTDYPECLMRDGAGGLLQSRTEATETAYRARYNGTVRAHCRKTRWTWASVADVIEDLEARAYRYRPASLRQIHAAIRQRLRDEWDADLITEGDVTQAHDALVAQYEAITKSTKPSPDPCEFSMTIEPTLAVGPADTITCQLQDQYPEVCQAPAKYHRQAGQVGAAGAVRSDCRVTSSHPYRNTPDISRPA